MCHVRCLRLEIVMLVRYVRGLVATFELITDFFCSARVYVRERIPRRLQISYAAQVGKNSGKAKGIRLVTAMCPLDKPTWHFLGRQGGLSGFDFRTETGA